MRFLNIMKVLSGDFKPGIMHLYYSDHFAMWIPGKFFREKIPFTEVEAIDVLIAQTVKTFWGTYDGMVGGELFLGQKGMIAGALSGGNDTDYTVLCTLRDGRSFVAIIPSETYSNVLVTCLAQPGRPTLLPPNLMECPDCQREISIRATKCLGCGRPIAPEDVSQAADLRREQTLALADYEARIKPPQSAGSVGGCLRMLFLFVVAFFALLAVAVVVVALNVDAESVGKEVHLSIPD